MGGPSLTTWLIQGAIALAVFAVAMGFLSAARQSNGRRLRLAGDVGEREAGPRISLGALTERLARMGDKAVTKDANGVSALRLRLIQAGFLNREAVAVYLGARSVALLAATAAVVLLMPWAMLGGGMAVLSMAGAFALVALLGPEQVLKARRRKVELEYLEGFPDLLDLLVASVQAGLSIDAAVSRVADELTRRYKHLAHHISLMTLDLRAGRQRRDAWSAFADRLGIEEARSLATMLRQAEEMGASLGATLSIFSDDMRIKRMLKAEEKAMALPAKLMVPLILFIFPCLLGVLVLPAAYRISQTLGAN